MKGKTREGRDRSRIGVALLLFLSWLVYTAGNVGRMDYSASMVAIIAETGASKDAAGLVAGTFFFAYGAGQLVNGLFCHKYNTRLVIFFALILSGASNLGMPFVGGVSAMKYLWLANGLAQSVLWSSLVKLQAEYLSEKDIGRSILIMSTTSASGTFLAYGISALNVAFFNWRVTFFVAAGLLVLSALLWLFGIDYVQRSLPKVAVRPAMKAGERKSALPKSPVLVCLCFICLFAVANGFVKDGITTWVPNVLTEVYGLETYFSIILTLVLPLISIFGAFLAKIAYQKLPNDIALVALFFLLGGGIAGLIYGLYRSSLVVAMISFALVACLMAAVNNLLTSAIPFRLRGVGRSGLFAGIIDTFCYVGSTLASFLLGGFSESAGWGAVFLLLMILSLAAGGVSLGFTPYWSKKMLPMIGNAARTEAPAEEKE